jgi:hypothetical protein
MGEAARRRILGAHTAAHRAAELESILHAVAPEAAKRDQLLLC